MNTAVQARAGTALSAVDRLKQGLTNYRQSAASTSKAPFLKLTKTGEWLYGQKGVEADLEARYVIHPESLGHGWVAWADGQVEWHMLVSIADPLPPIRDGLKAEKGAEKAVGFLIAAIDGDDEGMTFKWETNSVGGVDAFTDLIDEIYAKLEQDGADELPYPVVTLGTESYQHRKYGKIFKPVFTVVDWMTKDEVEDMAGAPEDDGDDAPDTEMEAETTAAEVDDTPRRGRRQQEEVEDIAPEPAPDAPRRGARGRRRRAA